MNAPKLIRSERMTKTLISSKKIYACFSPFNGGKMCEILKRELAIPKDYGFRVER